MSSSLIPTHLTGRKAGKLWVILIVIFILFWIFSTGAFRRECQLLETEHLANPHASATHVPAHDFYTSVYRGLQLFHLHDTHWPEPQGFFGIAARYVTAVYGLAFLAILLGWFFRGGLARWWHRRWKKNFVVVAGDGYGARQLVADLAKNNPCVVWVRKGSGHDIQEDEGVDEVLCINGDLDNTKFWSHSVCVHRAADVVVMLGNDAENVALSLKIEEALGKTPAVSPIRCHIQLSDLHLKKGLLKLLPAGDEHPRLIRRYFNPYEIMARLLVRQYPIPVEVLPEGEAQGVHHIIVGFDQLGQNVALKLAKMGQQVVKRTAPDGSIIFDVCKPRITVVDKRGDKVAAIFKRAHPGFLDTCHFQVVSCDCTEREFLELEFLNPENAAARTSLIFCLLNEATVVSTILMMLDVCERPGKRIDEIHYHAAHETTVGHLLHKEQIRVSKQMPIHTFAAEKDIFTQDVVLNSSLDLMARKIHEQYVKTTQTLEKDANNSTPAVTQNWEGLSEEDRESNREAADHLWAKMEALHYRLKIVSPHSAKPTPLSENIVALQQTIERNMEKLASAEHYRWMAWRLINGWKYGVPRDDARKLHPDIVEYGKLGEKEKEKDRANVRIVLQLIKEGRLRIRN